MSSKKPKLKYGQKLTHHGQPVKYIGPHGMHSGLIRVQTIFGQKMTINKPTGWE